MAEVKKEQVSRKGPRLHHVAVHDVLDPDGKTRFDNVVVFGTELEALRFIIGQPGWSYQRLSNGQQFAEVNGL